MNLLKLFLYTVLLGLLLAPSGVNAKQPSKKHILELCPCWQTEGGWEDSYWFIDEKPLGRNQYDKQTDAIQPISWVSVIQYEPDGGDCAHSSVNFTEGYCRTAVGVVSDGVCLQSNVFIISHLAEAEAEACHHALKELIKRGFQFE